MNPEKLQELWSTLFMAQHQQEMGVNGGAFIGTMAAAQEERREPFEDEVHEKKLDNAPTAATECASSKNEGQLPITNLGIYSYFVKGGKERHLG
jgi:hypothetical protein